MRTRRLSAGVLLIAVGLGAAVPASAQTSGTGDGPPPVVVTGAPTPTPSPTVDTASTIAPLPTVMDNPAPPGDQSVVEAPLAPRPSPQPQPDDRTGTEGNAESAGATETATTTTAAADVTTTSSIVAAVAPPPTDTTLARRPETSVLGNTLLSTTPTTTMTSTTTVDVVASVSTTCAAPGCAADRPGAGSSGLAGWMLGVLGLAAAVFAALAAWLVAARRSRREIEGAGVAPNPVAADGGSEPTELTGLTGLPELTDAATSRQDASAT